MANRQARWWLRKGERKSRRKALACGARRSGMWLCPSHLRTTLPFLDSTSALSFERRGRDRELLDVQLVQRRDPVVDVLRPVVGKADAEGERARAEQV